MLRDVDNGNSELSRKCAKLNAKELRIWFETQFYMFCEFLFCASFASDFVIIYDFNH